jgi:hypothetical protein
MPNNVVGVCVTCSIAFTANVEHVEVIPSDHDRDWSNQLVIGHDRDSPSQLLMEGPRAGTFQRTSRFPRRTLSIKGIDILHCPRCGRHARNVSFDEDDLDADGRNALSLILLEAAKTKQDIAVTAGQIESVSPSLAQGIRDTLTGSGEPLVRALLIAVATAFATVGAQAIMHTGDSNQTTYNIYNRFDFAPEAPDFETKRSRRGDSSDNAPDSGTDDPPEGATGNHVI